MNFDDLKDEKREKDGVICISDTCISIGKGEDFETTGEFCTECDCGVTKEQVTKENIDELNSIRLRYSQPTIRAS